jgi:hypothetical protein
MSDSHGIILTFPNFEIKTISFLEETDSGENGYGIISYICFCSSS